jgi:16S rRNA (guanine527-N7)-methyltransferase
MYDIHDKSTGLRLTPVSRETEARLDELVKILQSWQRIKNLVSGQAMKHIWTRHIADSLQLLEYAPGIDSKNRSLWLDLGSGGGFPGLVIAAALGDAPGLHVNLVESNARKCAFLREAARGIGVPVTVHQARIEDALLNFDKVNVISARALAALPQLIAWTDKLLTSGAIGLFPKGHDVMNELTETAKCWRLEYTIHNSLTDSTGRILRVTHATAI